MQLKPVLGPVQLVFYGVGVIIGAGVYSVIGAAAGLAQQSLWLSFVAGAVVALLTGFSYAEMTTSYPQAGAEYLYLKRALPRSDFAAFGIGLVILMGGAATVAVAFGGYLRAFVDVPTGMSAFILLIVCTAFNIFGLRESSWVNMVFTCVEVAGLLLVIAAGLTRGDFTESLLTQPQPGILPAAAILFFVYLGFEQISNLTEEVRNPAHDLPRAIFYSIGITTLLYVLVSLAVVALATPGELAASEAPLALAIQKVWPGAANLLSGIALFSTANTVLITLIATSRLAFSMGRHGEIPTAFATLLSNRGTPWIAAILMFAMSATLVPIGKVKLLAEVSSFAALLTFLAVNLALIILRYRLPQHPRPFRVPLTIGRMPLLPLAAIASICLLLANFDWEIYVAGVGALLLSGLAFLLRKWWRSAASRRKA
jgi:APA family basic amino acid/polyamine antiporter